MARNISNEMTPQEQQTYQELCQACILGELTRLKNLLDDPAMAEVALARPVKHYNLVEKPILNLWDLLQIAARAGHGAIVGYLLVFAQQHDIPYPELINRDSAVAAIEGASSLEVFKVFVEAWPQATEVDMSLVGDPLAYAVSKDQTELVKFLLDKGTNPNRRCQAHAGPGHYLRRSVRSSSFEVTNALLQHGAQVQHSGALREAARLGRVDALELLLKYGGDVNETLPPDVGFLVRDKRHQQATETPLHVAVLHDQVEAAQCLLAREADANKADAQGRTPRSIAQASSNHRLVELFST